MTPLHYNWHIYCIKAWHMLCDNTTQVIQAWHYCVCTNTGPVIGCTSSTEVLKLAREPRLVVVVEQCDTLVDTDRPTRSPIKSMLTVSTSVRCDSHRRHCTHTLWLIFTVDTTHTHTYPLMLKTLHTHLMLKTQHFLNQPVTIHTATHLGRAHIRKNTANTAVKQHKYSTALV